jgi:hypothetical protein
VSRLGDRRRRRERVRGGTEALEAVAYGAPRQARDRGDPLVAHLVDIVVDGDLAQLPRHAREHARHGRAVVGRRLWARLVLRPPRRQDGAPACLVAQQVQTVVRRDAIEPRHRRRIAAEAGAGDDGPHEHVMHGVPRTVLVAQQHPRPPPQHRTVAPVQLVEVRPVPEARGARGAVRIG